MGSGGGELSLRGRSLSKGCRSLRGGGAGIAPPTPREHTGVKTDNK